MDFLNGHMQEGVLDLKLRTKYLKWYSMSICHTVTDFDAGVLAYRAEEWIQQTPKVGEPGTGYYWEILWENRAPSSPQKGTMEPIVVCCLGVL